MYQTLEKEMGKFLDSVAPWDLYCHITYRPWPRRYINPRGFLSPIMDTPSPVRARRLIREFVELLETKINSRVDYFVGEELGKLGRFHQHILLAGDGLRDLYRRELWEWWKKRAGRNRIEPFDPGKGAAYYLASAYPAKQTGLNAHRGLEWDLRVGNRPHISHPPKSGGKIILVPSVNLSRDFFKCGFSRRKR